MKDRYVVRFADGQNDQSAEDNLNRYCCNTCKHPVQIVVLPKSDGTGGREIYAIVEENQAEILLQKVSQKLCCCRYTFVDKSLCNKRCRINSKE